MKKISIFLVTILCSIVTFAESVTFQASAPGQVPNGHPFQVTYTVNQQASNFRAPSFAGFDVLAGPYTSTSMQSRYVNGQHSTQYSQTYTMTLMPTKEGTFTITPASISVDGSSYNSNSLKIVVVASDQQPTSATNTSTSSSRPTNTSSNSGESVFVKTSVSKTTVWEQEPILVSYKIYFAGCDIAQFNPRMPDFKGFVKQDIDLGEIQANTENYNGRAYQTAVLYQALLYPQQAGDIKIDPATYETILRVRSRAQVRSIFDDFFDTYTNVERSIKTNGETIHVKKLPSNKPVNFTGGVGKFSLDHTISSTNVTTNDAITLRLTISGKGNMNLIGTPQVTWPTEFEVYDPKVVDNIKTTTSGLSGTKTIEYLIIPRASGDYSIPAIAFSYFDPDKGEYQSLSTPEYAIHVEKSGDEGNTQNNVVNFTDKQNITEQNTDIRYIDTTPLDWDAHDAHNWLNIQVGSLGYWLLYILPLLLTIALFIIFRRRIRENSNIALVKYKRANKQAQKRLRKAQKLMNLPDSQALFYEEIERAALSYLSDRLSIPTADLNKDTIAAILRSKNVEEPLIEQVNIVLSTAEFARYAPSTEQGMQDLYNSTSQLINQLENQKL